MINPGKRERERERRKLGEEVVRDTTVLEWEGVIEPNRVLSCETTRTALKTERGNTQTQRKTQAARKRHRLDVIFSK
jgi:hypothetical protein